jgi:hypothetical protein
MSEPIPIRGHGREHPALSTVLWNHTPPHCETAFYKGHELRVRHMWMGELGDTSQLFNLGFIDGVLTCHHTGSMQGICELLFAAVDKLEG